jgi:hypothetical protein
MNRNAASGLGALRDPDTVAFLLVTSPAGEAMTDAFFFRRKTIELDLPFRGFVLNRSQAAVDERVPPPDDLFGPRPTELQRSALRKLQQLAVFEQASVLRDRELLETLKKDAGDEAFAVALPVIAGGAERMESLVALGNVLLAA